MTTTRKPPVHRDGRFSVFMEENGEREYKSDSDSRKRAKHVLLQDARLGKEVLLGFREGNAFAQFQAQKFGTAYEIGNLEQTVRESKLPDSSTNMLNTLSSMI